MNCTCVLRKSGTVRFKNCSTREVPDRNCSALGFWCSVLFCFILGSKPGLVLLFCHLFLAILQGLNRILGCDPYTLVHFWKNSSWRKTYLGNWGSSDKFYSLTFDHMSARFFYDRYKIICSFIFDPIINAFILKSLCRFHNGWCYWENFMFANFLKIQIWKKSFDERFALCDLHERFPRMFDSFDGKSQNRLY